MEDINRQYAEVVCKALGLNLELLKYPKCIVKQTAYMYLAAYSSEIVTTYERPKITDTEVNPQPDDGIKWLIDTTSGQKRNPTRRLSNCLGDHGKIVWEFDTFSLIDMPQESQEKVFSSHIHLFRYLTVIRDAILFTKVSQIKCLNEMKSFIHKSIVEYAEMYMPLEDFKLLPPCLHAERNGAYFTDGSGSSIHSFIFGGHLSIEAACLEYEKEEDLTQQTSRLTKAGTVLALAGLPLLFTPLAPTVAPCVLTNTGGLVCAALTANGVFRLAAQELQTTVTNVGVWTHNTVLRTGIATANWINPIAWKTKKIQLVQRLDAEILSLIKETHIYTGPIAALERALFAPRVVRSAIEVCEGFKETDYIISNTVIKDVQPQIGRHTCDKYGVLYN